MKSFYRLKKFRYNLKKKLKKHNILLFHHLPYTRESVILFSLRKNLRGFLVPVKGDVEFKS